MKKIGFLTAPHIPDLTADDKLVIPYLQSSDLEVVPVIWTEAIPEGLDALIMRSTWAYYQQPERFEAWLGSLAALHIPVLNPAPMLLDNLHKAYLLRLSERGWPIVPTRLLSPDTELTANIPELMSQNGWSDVILKPELSASGHATYRLKSGDSIPDDLHNLQATGRTLMLQPFCPRIHSEGEWSLLFFGGSFSHAVLKVPDSAHYLVQEDHGGRTAAASPPPELLLMAKAIVTQECPQALYARVDCVFYQDSYRLMELELLEPSLYLAHEPSAAARWAQAIKDRLMA